MGRATDDGVDEDIDRPREAEVTRSNGIAAVGVEAAGQAGDEGAAHKRDQLVARGVDAHGARRALILADGLERIAGMRAAQPPEEEAQHAEREHQVPEFGPRRNSRQPAGAARQIPGVDGDDADDLAKADGRDGQEDTAQAQHG
jgi:hypothetical protein